jgi:GH35 family endo-1,4-beta-xylanase
VKDLSFVHVAFQAALASAVNGSRLVYNDYSTGQNNSKTECMFKLLADLNANAGIPYDRLAIGFQSHISAKSGGFASKADLMSTFSRLHNLGADGFITEIDIALQANTTADQRYQAAIWGDYLDVRGFVCDLEVQPFPNSGQVCLYNSNCHEFLSWDNRDDRSWVTPSDTTVGMATVRSRFCRLKLQT